MIYFDNAATTAMSKVALKAMIDISKDKYGNASAGYSFGREAKKILKESRRIIAECIGAQPEEIYFTSGGTESNNWVIGQAELQGISQIVVSEIEHHAILRPAEKLAERTGYNVNKLPVNRDGIIITQNLSCILNNDRTLVSVMLQNNETGILQPIKEISEIVHSKNANSIFHTDAVQSIGHKKINVKELGVDLLSASAHKFNGPKGVGFLFVRKDCSISPMILGGAQENSLRAGTENVAGIYSMAKALEENCVLMDKHNRDILMLERVFLETLEKEKINFTINGKDQERAVGILNVCIKGIDAEGLLNVLDTKSICISIGSACNSEKKERSHVLSAMNLEDELIDSSFRISIGRYNTKEEVLELARNIINYVKIFENNI